MRCRSTPMLPDALRPSWKGSAASDGPRLRGAGGVRHDHERRLRLDSLDADQRRHPRGEAALALRHEREPVALVLALDEARCVDPPGLAVAAQEAELRERDAHLDGPALRVVRHRRVPHRVPRLVRPGVVEDDLVALHARRAHLEADARPAVQPRVEVDRESVGLGGLVATRQAAVHEGGVAVEEPHAHVERRVVVERGAARSTPSPADPRRDPSARSASTGRRPARPARPDGRRSRSAGRHASRRPRAAAAARAAARCRPRRPGPRHTQGGERERDDERPSGSLA